LSQFRIKQIDIGISDSWDFRINDEGIIVGDDVVAEDPNELAQAITETQDLLLHATVYAPSQLIDPTHGLFERVKTIEDTVGTTSLQNAYENGRFITVEPGRNLVLGASGEIELDSSGNLRFSPNTMNIYNGSLKMDLTYSGITSSSSDLTFGTIAPTKDCFIKGGRSLYLKDGNLTTNVPLSEVGVTTLSTTSQSVVGAINEINGGFTSAGLQQIYNQSSPPEIETSFSNGAVRLTNGTGNPNTPALVINGNEEVEKLHANEISVSPIAGSANLSIASNGNLNTIGDIVTTSKMLSPRFENLFGEITFEDSRGIVKLSETTDPGLDTVKQSFFGAINELKAQMDSNSLVSAAMAIEHNTSTGTHGIITTQASAGTNNSSRLSIINDLGVTKITANANGEIDCKNITTNSYDLNAESLINETHRNGDGTDHSAFASHLTDTNPHNIVGTFSKVGAVPLRGSITVSEGVGVSLVQTGNNIEISAPVGSTLQGVYDNQATGDWQLDTAGGKDLYFKDSVGVDILSLDNDFITVNKDIISIGNREIRSITGDLSLDAPTTAKKVIIEGIDFTDGTTMSIDDSVPTNIVGAINDIVERDYIEVVNGTGYVLSKGTAVCVREDGELWISYPDIDPANAVNSNWGEPSLLWHVTGIVDETIMPGVSGRVKVQGRITASIGGIQQFYPGDTLYLANTGKSTITINSLPSNNDCITLDTGGAAKVYEALTVGGADPALGRYDVSTDGDNNRALDETRDNLYDALDNKTWMANGTDFYLAPFISGKRAKGRINVIAAGNVGDTITITPNTIYGGNAVTLTAIAIGGYPSILEYELGATPAETAVYIAEAINRTTRNNGAGSEGQLLEAEAYGDAVIVKFYQPGVSGNNTTLTSIGGSTTIVNPANGTCELDVYMSRRVSTGSSHLCSSDNAAISITNFTADESDKPYLCRREITNPTRTFSEFDKLIKVGKVIDHTGFDVTFQIEFEEPEYLKKQYRGALSDLKY